ncbi:CaiB/BaiF CoA transferase family protein [Nonomuraea gerenzanensis]|uniref:L-carnitine dehydratase/bile acid-inducible protein F n=1 Tax=Nonomuraea gerenzanensis TaxID=93944 RepID=A0A1M4E4Y8_9ACTN|nr:CoA transferase [Nonomuraea gerenzanensis]UBU16048.1 CoA transferase [Nonomuraea gerenzanensis]SBO93850.1 L-carnitine dehydratase/bile acid-inducible protein F [Nonomuraea gerenzanensis]
MSGALSGLLVADFSRVLAGPYCTMLLADLGAEVVKVERPGTGDDTRAWGPPYASSGEATYFLGVNRNKRSIALDLRADAEVARALAARADVLVENFKPGTMDRLGLGYEALRALNPGLVYCSITGFGSGAGAGLPGYDLIAQAVGGLMSVTGEPDGPGTKAGVALVDVITGLHAALGIMAALRHRDGGGEGQRIEVSLLSSLLSALTNHASAYAAAGVVPQAMGNRHPSIVPYEVFQAADRPIVIAAGNDRQFQALCAALERPDLAGDPRYATNAQRVGAREPLVAELNAALAGRTADEWFERLTAAGVPCGPINDLAAAFALAGELGLEPAVELGGAGQVANPIRLSATPPAYHRPPPALGQDDAWLREILDR